MNFGEIEIVVKQRTYSTVVIYKTLIFCLAAFEQDDWICEVRGDHTLFLLIIIFLRQYNFWIKDGNCAPECNKLLLKWCVLVQCGELEDGGFTWSCWCESIWERTHCFITPRDPHMNDRAAQMKEFRFIDLSCAEKIQHPHFKIAN